ncbi:kynureninase [Sphingomonas profundi]|uniref:kynureninase n=1 Tax=Alterirhizorhabdus profundi TaxID=2681549 RepID=UPI0012E78658|nr:kynureninase [Sphingomonas profundi]
MARPTPAEIIARDAADPLAAFRDRFALPDGVIYLDGNSLGPLPRATAARMARVIEGEWGTGLIRSWNEHDWIGAPQRIGGKIGRLIGAAPGTVIATDSTSVNLFKLIVAATALSPERGTILTEAGNFPTDLHVARQAAALLGKRLRVCDTADLENAIDADTALIVLAHVHYRSGHRHDMAAITAHAAAHGARVLWDLSHSVGAVPLALAADGVELAVGCGYKYLNGGPGAPAFLHVAGHLHERMQSPIAGWLGHAAPFDFADAYRPAPGVDRFLAGTPPMLSLLALEAGVDLMLAADQAALHAKARDLHDLFAADVAAECPALTRISPDEAERRGSHIAFVHSDAFAIMQALIARGVIGDFRSPDVLRFGLTPLYLRHRDIRDAVTILSDIITGEHWRDPRFFIRDRVT